MLKNPKELTKIKKTPRINKQLERGHKIHEGIPKLDAFLLSFLFLFFTSNELLGF